MAVLVTTSGGLVAGDRIDVAVTAQRGRGGACHRLGGGENLSLARSDDDGSIRRSQPRTAAWLEFLPPETILFDAARLRRHTRVELAEDAGFLGGGIIVFGRRARARGLPPGCCAKRGRCAAAARSSGATHCIVDGEVVAAIDGRSGLFRRG